MAESVPMTTTGWPHGHGPVLGRALLRQQPQDFVVDEQLKHSASGSGEHLWVRVEKSGANTQWVARQLARWAQVPARAVSYAGLKDRHAVTRQTFSIHLPGKPDPQPAEFQDFRILEQQRSARKLQRGALSGNRFEICLAQWQPAAGDNPDSALAQRLEDIRRYGVPNYFGEQRFGHDNLNQALAWLVQGGPAPRERELRSLYFSVVRSYLFNQVVAERVRTHSWHSLLPGEAVMLDGSQSWFDSQGEDPEILAQRCAAFDVHPSGPLPGSAAPDLSAAAAQVENTVLAPYATWIQALAEHGLEAQRRPLRLAVRDLAWRATAAGPVLTFSLPAGAYATTVIREIVAYTVPGDGVEPASL